MYTRTHTYSDIHTQADNHQNPIFAGRKMVHYDCSQYHCLTVPTADGKGLFTTFNTMENIKKDHQLHYFLSTDMQCSATTPPMR